MLVGKILKCLSLFLISVIIMTVLFYLTALCLSFVNEYVFGVSLGVIYSVIIFLSGYKAISKIKIPFRMYLVFTTLAPALLYDAYYAFLRNTNAVLSILDADSNKMYYFLFLSFAFSVATIAVTLIELIRSLIRSRS